MHDDELATLLMRADPAMTDAAAPLSLRALHDLEKISAGELRPHTVRPPVSRWLLLPAVAALAVVGIFAVQALAPNDPTATRALAATLPPLAAYGTPIPVRAAMTEALAAVATSDYPDAPERRSEHEGWYAEITFDAPGPATAAVITPQKTTFTWNEDLSGHITTIAGETVDPEESGMEGAVEPPVPGTVLRQESILAGNAGILYPDPIPTDPTALANVFETNAGWPEQADPVMLLGAVEALYNEWTLDRDQQAALLEVLQSQPQLESIGMVTDRLGREGAAFVARSADSPAMENTIVVSLETGRVLSVEQTYVGGLPEFEGVVEPPAVVSYTAWTN